MKEIRKGKFSIRQSKSTVGWAKFAYIIEKHGHRTSQRFGGLTKEDLSDIRDVIDEFISELS